MKTNGGKINKLLIILFIQSFIVAIPASGMLSGSKVASAWLQRALAQRIVKKPNRVANIFLNKQQQFVRNFSTLRRFDRGAFLLRRRLVKKIGQHRKKYLFSLSVCSNVGLLCCCTYQFLENCSRDTELKNLEEEVYKLKETNDASRPLVTLGLVTGVAVVGTVVVKIIKHFAQ